MNDWNDWIIFLKNFIFKTSVSRLTNMPFGNWYWPKLGHKIFNKDCLKFLIISTDSPFIHNFLYMSIGSPEIRPKILFDIKSSFYYSTGISLRKYIITVTSNWWVHRARKPRLLRCVQNSLEIRVRFLWKTLSGTQKCSNWLDPVM